jgi:hypothetical protein
MLRRAENVTFAIGEFGFLGGFKTKHKGPLHVSVGRSRYVVHSDWLQRELDALLVEASSYPTRFVENGEKALWGYKEKWYWDNEGLNADEIYAVLTARDVRAKKSIDRAKSIAGMATAPALENRRGHLSAELRQLVWMRDGGACTQCGANIELQFDHIIPVAMGGATNEENLQILCGTCNRTKGNSVG